MKTLHTAVYVILALTVFIPIISFAPSLSFADNCSTITTNSEWIDNFTLMQNAVKTGDIEMAHQSFNILKEICPRSPALNYLIGMAYKQAGQRSRALEYIIIATRNTAEFMVEPEFVRTLWNLRYELENPETTSEAQEKMQTQLDMLIAFSNQLQNENQQLLVKNKANLEDSIHNTRIVMWTGIGIGITGFVLGGAGTMLLVMTHDPIRQESTFSHTKGGITQKQDINGTYIAGWSLVGAGIASAVTGSIMAAIGGAKHASSKKKLQETIAFDVSPNQARLTWVF